MTRLTEALARAGGEKNGVDSATGDASAAVPSSWRFDSDEAAEPAAPSAEAQSTPDAPEVVEDTSVDTREVVDPATTPLQTARTLVVGAHPNHILVEQYRHLAAALHHAKLKTGARTVMVASAVRAEGKTTTATNLALTLSESHQRKVLLVDADLRRPSIHTFLQLSNRYGLMDTLRDISPNARVPLHKVSPTLSVITAGRATEDPMSALVSDMMKRFVEEAAEQYDWVVLDTPPIALLSDANLLAAMIDLAILVVGASATPYPLVRRAVAALGPSKILGVVLNRAERSDLSGAYGYDGYGYSYSQPTRPSRRWGFPFRAGR